MFLGLFGRLFLGVLGSLLLGFFLGFLLGDVGQLLLFGLLRLRLFLGFVGFLCFIGLLGFGYLFRLIGLFGSFGLLSRFLFLLFRSLYRFLLDLFLLHLFFFGLARSSFLGLTGNLLIGLGGSLAFRLELVQRRLDDRLGRRQVRGHGKADEEHAENQDVQAYGPDTGPEVAFRGGGLSLLHQGASVIKPTLPTPAFCNPPMAPMTAP
ncbi:hypothetical protein D3C80_1266730 [compost metagenome]